MKKILTYAALCLILGMVVTSCSNNSATTTTEKDSTKNLSNSPVFQNEWDQYFLKSPVKTDIGLHQPVDEKIAQHCIDSLEDLMRHNQDLKKIKFAYTDGVWFGGQELDKWFKDFHVLRYDSIAFRLGIYTQEAYDQYHDQGLAHDHIGRITVFIWPYNIDPVTRKATTGTSPYNIGGIHP